MFDTLRSILKPLASLRLTVVLIGLAMLLIYAGTWAQLDDGIWQVQHKYFHSRFVWIDFQTFFPRPEPGHARIPGGFPMLGGYTIGLLLLLNLLAAHIQRFKATWRDLALIPLLALMIVPLLVWQYTGAQWLFNTVHNLGIDLAQFGIPFFVWVVLVSALVGIPFFATLFYLHGRRGAIIMIHLGLLLLLLGEGITSATQVERQMVIDVGSYTRFAQDIREVELAVVDPSPADHNEHIVIPASVLQSRGTIHDPRLPFDITINDYFPNSDIVSSPPGSQAPLAPSGSSGLSQATAGSNIGVKIIPRDRFKGTDAQNVDFPSAYVTLSKNGQSLGTYLLTVLELDPQFKPIHQPQPVAVDGKTYQVQLRYKRQYRPYTVQLLDFVHEKYTGTDVPKDFASRIRIVNPTTNEDREVRIWMNHPLRYKGETFYQSSFKPGDKTSILLVVENPALVLPYAAVLITGLGLLIHFLLTLSKFLSKRSALMQQAALPTQASRPRGTPARASKQPRQPQSAPPGRVGLSPHSTGAALLFPALVLIACLIGVIVAAIPRSITANSMDLADFGRLPVSFNGRVVPFDSLARNAIKVMRGKESLSDGNTSVPPLRFLLETFTGAENAQKYKVFRIDHPLVKSMLGLKEEDRYFAFSDLMPKAAVFDKEFNNARNLSRTERNDFHEAILDLGRRVQLFMTLTRIQDLHVVAPATAAQKDWQTLDEGVTAAGGDPNRATGTTAAFIQIVRAFHGNDAPGFNRAVADYLAAVEPIAPRAVSRASIETWYNQFSPFFVCCFLYVLVFVLAAASWIAWTKPFARAAFWTLALTFIVHTIGIVIRIYLSGRAPVTNLESSAIFIGWVVVLLGIGFELVYRNGIGSVIAAAIGFLTLCIYINLAKDDTMKVLEAVLDTNFWLWTHVPIVNMGYSATFLAWGLGVAYVIMGVFTRALTPERGKELARMIYGCVCFGVLFSFVGTVLGGIWADQSWGRFWGWDPKENGAVLIVLANAMLLHARWGGLVKERGIAALAIFGGIVTVWSWFGTNLLGVGLHSYGFMSSTAAWVIAFAIAQLFLIVLANLPLPYWRSFRITHPTRGFTRNQVRADATA